MTIHAANSRPLGEWIDDGRHQPFRAIACPLQVLDYDESQMKESNHESRAQRGTLLYDC